MSGRWLAGKALASLLTLLALVTPMSVQNLRRAEAV